MKRGFALSKSQEEEIARRLKDIRAGRAQFVPWEVVRDQLQKEFASIRSRRAPKPPREWL